MQGTSFRGVDLKIKFRPGTKERRDYLPVYPCDPHPDNGLLLHLEGSSPQLRKKTYINTRDRYEIPFRCLRPYRSRGFGDARWGEFTLSGPSYEILVDYAHLSIPKPHGETSSRPVPHAPNPSRSAPVETPHAINIDLIQARTMPAYYPAASHRPLVARQAISSTDSGSAHQIAAWTLHSASTQPRLASHTRHSEYHERQSLLHHYTPDLRQQRQQPSGRSSYGTCSSTRAAQYSHGPRSHGASTASRGTGFGTVSKILLGMSALALGIYGFYCGWCWVVEVAVPWVRSGFQATGNAIVAMCRDVGYTVGTAVRVVSDTIRHTFKVFVWQFAQRTSGTYMGP